MDVLTKTLAGKLKNLEDNYRERKMTADLLQFTEKTLKDYFGHFRNIRESGENLVDMQLLSTCLEILDYFNAFDEFLYFKEKGDILSWITVLAITTGKEVKAIYRSLLSEKISKTHADKSVFENQPIGPRLFLEKLRFVSFLYTESYRLTELEVCQKGLSELLRIVNEVFCDENDPYVFELTGFLSFWLGKSYRQQNFDQAREHFQNAKQAFTFASLAAQNKSNFTKGFHKYQIKRIYFVNLAEARLLLIERKIFSALITVETALSFIPEGDLLAKAYGKYIRGTCQRVLHGRQIRKIDLNDLNEALDCFLGFTGYPPSPRHAINVVKELVIAYVILDSPEKAEEILNKFENLIESGNELRFSKLKRKEGKITQPKWERILPGLMSRINRKKATKLFLEAHQMVCSGKASESYETLQISVELLIKSLEFANEAVENGDPTIPASISDAFIIRGEANFYMRNFVAAEKDFNSAIKSNQKPEPQRSVSDEVRYVHENPEITGIANIYLGKIKLIQGNLLDSIPYFAAYLAIESFIQNKWVKELYANCAKNTVIFDIFDFQEEFNARTQKFKKKTLLENYLIKKIQPMFKSQVKLANFLEINKGTLNKRLKK